MYDLLITGGTVVDGTGAPRRIADVAVEGDRIAAVEPGLVERGATARGTIDARGLIVTPGFVDVHTHYDGQVTWDDLLEPSSAHGVTTVVMGNCGVGFAPVEPGREQWLIQLMEGVEDIPGAALAEGISWGWESFPDYLDVLDDRCWSVDVATQVPHSAVRAYVMGERGARNEPATPDEIGRMERLVRDGVEAGALGVSTSRTIAHRAMDGEPVPGTFAAEEEVFALGRGLAAAGGGVFELAPAGTAGLDVVAPRREIDWMRRLSLSSDLDVTFALLQVSTAPDLWRELLDECSRAADEGARLRPQVAGRPFGFLVGLQTTHAFGRRPTYRRLAGLPLGERVRALRDPAVKAAVLAEPDGPGDGGIFDGLAPLVAAMAASVHVLGDPPDYEPPPERSVGRLAAERGETAESMLYDLLLADEGRALLMLPLFNYVDGDHEAIRAQLEHPLSVSGLADGGAHCGMICDASLPTTMLTHWARDRSRGPRFTLEWVVKAQTHDTAALYGLGDRGTVEVGRRADLNVIDFDALTLRPPRLVHDLPAGGRRLLQDAVGYVATIVGGVVTRRDGVDTGARPGRLVRGRR